MFPFPEIDSKSQPLVLTVILMRWCIWRQLMLLLLWRFVIGTTVTRQVSFFLLFWRMMAINVDVLLRQMIESFLGETVLSKILLRVSNKKTLPVRLRASPSRPFSVRSSSR